MTDGQVIFPAPDRHELCSVSTAAVRGNSGFIKKAASNNFDCYAWDSLNRTWQIVKPNAVRPGMVLLFHCRAGGYNPLLGWTGDPKNAPVSDRRPEKGNAQDAMDGDDLAANPLAITDHLRDVGTAAESLESTLQRDFTDLLRRTVVQAEWLATFTRETSPKRLEESLNAISAIRSTDTATKVSEHLWTTLPKKPRTQFEHEEWINEAVAPAQEGRGTGGGQTSVPTVKRSFIPMDRKVFDILRSCVSVKAFNQRVAEEWTKGDPAWQKRILLAAPSFSGGTLDDQIPLFKLAEELFNSKSSDPIAIEKLADLMMNTFTRENPDEQKEDRLYQALASAKRLNDDDWLAKTWERTYPWRKSNPRIGNYVQARSVDIVLDANSPMTSVAAALKILLKITELNSRPQEVSGLEVTPRTCHSVPRSHLCPRNLDRLVRRRKLDSVLRCKRPKAVRICPIH